MKIELKGEIDKSTIRVGDFNIPFSLIGKNEEKFSKCI